MEVFSCLVHVGASRSVQACHFVNTKEASSAVTMTTDILFPLKARLSRPNVPSCALIGLLYTVDVTGSHEGSRIL